MATLRSLYSTEVTASVPTDRLPPKPPVITGLAQQIQQDSSVTHGRSLVTVQWAAPTQNERIGGEYLVVSNGLVQNLETTYDPIVAGALVYSMSNFGGGGRGDTTLSAPASPKAKTVSVGSVANFAIGDWVRLTDGSQTEYAKIASVGASTLTFETRLLGIATALPAGTTTVKEADAALKTGGGTHYTLTLATGVLVTVAGAFPATDEIVIDYTTTLADLDGYTLLRHASLLSDTTYESVSLQPGVVVVSDAITSGATSYVETLTAADNGESWYYYLYAKDDEATPNRSEVMVGGPLIVETIPSIPQNLGKTVGDQAVILSWNSLGPGSSDGNTNGYSVYRNNGNTLDAPNLRKISLIVIPKAQLTFEDSQDGIDSGDRVAAGTVALPANGSIYTYVIEAEDTTTGWTTGTQNQSFGVGANLVGSKTA